MSTAWMAFFRGSLVVERLAGIRDENRGNHQGVAENEDGRSGVPGRIATRFERGADAPVGERRGIGFLLDELLAGKFFHHAAFAVVFHKSIMFLGRAFGERLEPVCTVGHTQLHGPFLHTGSHDIGRLQVERRTVVYHIAHLFIYVGREIFEHLLAGKYVTPVCEESRTLIKIKENILFDDEKGILYFNTDIQVHLVNYKLKLFVLLLDSPGHFQTSEEIKKIVWGKTGATNDVLNTTIRRLRKDLENIPDLKIVFENGGYRLNIL